MALWMGLNITSKMGACLQAFLMDCQQRRWTDKETHYTNLVLCASNLLLAPLPGLDWRQIGLKMPWMANVGVTGSDRNAIASGRFETPQAAANAANPVGGACFGCMWLRWPRNLPGPDLRLWLLGFKRCPSQFAAPARILEVGNWCSPGSTGIRLTRWCSPRFLALWTSCWWWGIRGAS